MIKERLNNNQAIYIIILFLIGSSAITGINTTALQDSWISVIIAIILSIPFVFMYARIIKLNPDKNIFEIMEYLFGKIIGKLFIVLFSWYAIHLGAMVVTNFTKFIGITNLLNTPEIVISALLAFTIIYICKSSITTLGKWSVMAIIIIIIMTVSTILIGLQNMDYTYFLPMFSHPMNQIVQSGVSILTFPFLESVLFLGISNFFKRKSSPYKIYTFGIIIAGIILLIYFTRNLTILGPKMMSSVYFPSYVVARIIQLGSFFARIEGIITINYILTGITKITICLLVASIGISKLFNIKDYKSIVTPTGLLILAISMILYPSIMEMYGFIDVYSIYAVPFQIIIPVLVWIASEIKMRKNKHTK